jgi:hypothetical protein
MVRRKLQEAADPPENAKNGFKGKKKCFIKVQK